MHRGIEVRHVLYSTLMALLRGPKWRPCGGALASYSGLYCVLSAVPPGAHRFRNWYKISLGLMVGSSGVKCLEKSFTDLDQRSV